MKAGAGTKPKRKAHPDGATRRSNSANKCKKPTEGAKNRNGKKNGKVSNNSHFRIFYFPTFFICFRGINRKKKEECGPQSFLCCDARLCWCTQSNELSSTCGPTRNFVLSKKVHPVSVYQARATDFITSHSTDSDSGFLLRSPKMSAIRSVRF